MLIQKEHLILKIRYSLLSSSLLQLFIEFSMFIDQKHATKLLETTMDYAAELKFSSYHPNAVLLQTATEKHLRRKSIRSSVLLIYPSQFYKDHLYKRIINSIVLWCKHWLLVLQFVSERVLNNCQEHQGLVLICLTYNCL